tara:strand:+ start:341 stop:934 length:594 start_codon:yes stop_codon:yes gene_type:complete
MSLQFRYSKVGIEVGLDEAGRGCLSGPVVAGAVILPEGFSHPLLNDSKKLTEKQRLLLQPIIEAAAVSYGIGVVSEQEIDEINILQASILAMHRAVDSLSVCPEFIIVDGNKFNPYKNIPHATIVKGDAKFMSIAAASILAKTHRDFLMDTLHEEFPFYNWKKNKGYPTKEHRAGILKHGASIYHRKTFRLLAEEKK